MTDVASDTEFESDIVNPFETINGRNQYGLPVISSYKLRVGVGTWFDPPGVIENLFVNRNEEIQVKHTTALVSLLTIRPQLMLVMWALLLVSLLLSDFLTVTQAGFCRYTFHHISFSRSSLIVKYIQFQVFSGQNVGTHHSTQWQVLKTLHSVPSLRM